MKEICEALGFDPTNHHNASKCPYCEHGLAHHIAELEAQVAMLKRLNEDQSKIHEKQLKHWYKVTEELQTALQQKNDDR